MSTTLHVVIKNRKKTFLDEDALSVTSFNDKGVFDILPYHENFISLIKKMVTVRTPVRVVQLQFESAVLSVSNDLVNVFVSDLDPYFEDTKKT